MAEDQTEFTLSTDVEIGFTAEDLRDQLTRRGLMDLIDDIVGLMDPATRVLLGRLVELRVRSVGITHPHLLQLTDQELEDMVEDADESDLPGVAP